MEIKTSLSIIVFASFEVLHSVLLVKGLISGGNYVALFLATSILAFGIYFNDEIKELDLSRGKLVLEKAIKIKEETKSVALSIIKLLAANSSYTSGSWKQRRNFNNEMTDALNKIDVPQKQINKIMKVPKIMEKTMKVGRSKLDDKERKVVNKLFNLDE